MVILSRISLDTSVLFPFVTKDTFGIKLDGSLIFTK